jgi:APA family basic amino acid/polyamine antiporter
MTPTPHRDEGLLRTLGVLAAGAFVVTNMIGSGIFTVPAFVRVATGGALASLGVWVAAGLLGLCGALCYAELATRIPDAGGEYRYLTLNFGPMWGFLSGWTSFVVGFSAAVAASALGAVAYAAALIPGWDPATVMVPGLGISQGAAAGAAIVAVLTAVHCLGVRSSGRFQGMLALVILAAIFVLLVGGFASGRGAWVGLVGSAEPRSSWWVALLQVSYAYAGWNAAAYMAGEVRDPARTLPRAILGGTLFVLLVYVALNALFFYALPEPRWEPTIAVAQLAAERLFGSGGAVLVSGIIGLAMFGSVSAMTAVGPRVYFAMARDGLAPEAMARLSPEGRVPVIAIAAQGGLAALLALTGAFETLLIYIGSSLLLFNGLTVATLFVVRRRDGAPAPGQFRTPLFPLTPLVFLAVTVAAWVNGLVDAPLPTGAALATLALGAGVYALGRRRGAFGDGRR